MEANKELHIIQCLLDWSHSYLYVQQLNCSVQILPCLFLIGLKIKTVQPETFFFSEAPEEAAQSLFLETKSLPLLLLNRPGIFPQTGSSDVLPVIQVRFFQLLQTNSKNNRVTLMDPWFKVHMIPNWFLFSLETQYHHWVDELSSTLHEKFNKKEKNPSSYPYSYINY